MQLKEQLKARHVELSQRLAQVRIVFVHACVYVELSQRLGEGGEERQRVRGECFRNTRVFARDRDSKTETETETRTESTPRDLWAKQQLTGIPMV